MRKLIFSLMSMILLTGCTGPLYSGSCVLPEGMPFQFVNSPVTVRASGVMVLHDVGGYEIMIHSFRCTMAKEKPEAK